MELYFDTSCLIKLYLDEEDTHLMRYYVNQVDNWFVSSIGYVEVYSAFRRRLQEHSFTQHEFIRYRDVFETDWQHAIKVNVDDSILHHAAKLSYKHNIRTLDAIHLASALYLVEHDEMDDEICFLTTDHQLQTAAHREKLKTKL